MYDRLRGILLHALKVPPEPHPPLGDPASVKIFRAGRNYFRLRLTGWGIAQALALAGIVFWVVMFLQVDDRVAARRNRAPPATIPAGAAMPKEGDHRFDGLKQSVNALAGKHANHPDGFWASLRSFLVEVALILPPWALRLLWVLKVAGIAFYLAQLGLTYAARRLEYEMHWYIVTDRSLRLRTGVWKVQELTMSFANLQQVEVTQGPLQRLLGLADVRVQSAGGSSLPAGRAGAWQLSLHTGFFHGVEHAAEIRDLILERLRHFRDAGLGDPDDRKAGAIATRGEASPGDLLLAARELRDEARRLREAVSQKP